MMKVMTAMYTMRRGGSYDRFIMMLEAFLERGSAVHCLSLTTIEVQNPSFYNHTLFYPFRNKESLIAKLIVLFFLPLWSIWIGWRHKIDLIIAFGSLYAFLQGFSKWILKKPMVTFIRGSSYFGMTVQNLPRYILHFNKLVEYFGFLFSDRIITNNIAARDEISKGLGKRKKIDVQLLYNNIPSMNIRKPEDISKTREKYGIPENAKVLVTAGILNRGKNIETLIECLPKMEVKNIYLLIAGDSSTETDFRYKNSLQDLTKKLGVEKKVIFVGWLEKEELWKTYLASDFFVLPSLNEGMPNAMLEALGLNLPSLGSNIPGIRDILGYEELMFNPVDVSALTQKIEYFFSDINFSNHIISLCQERKLVLFFDWKEKAYKMITERLSYRSSDHRFKDRGLRDGS